MASINGHCTSGVVCRWRRRRPHYFTTPPLSRSFGREGRKRKEKVDRMEWKGSFPLHYHTARPAGPPTGARCASIWNGGTGRTDGRRRGGKEGRKERRSPEERGASTTLLKKATEKRGADRSGEGKANQQSFFFPSLPASLTSCPAPLPSLSLRRLFRLTPLFAG